MPSIPLLQFREMFHIGGMQGPPAGRNDSLEGNMLSVSRCPCAWQRIAKCRGPLWRLLKPDALFVDYFAVARDESLGALVKEWGVSVGLMTLEGEGRRAGRPVAMPTDALRERFRTDRALSPKTTFSLVVAAWAEDVAPELGASVDGVYWREVYDPAGHSAPRGGILPSRLGRWRREPVPEWDGGPTLAGGAMLSDDALLGRRPARRTVEFDPSVLEAGLSTPGVRR